MALDEIQIGGLGARRKRVEDASFIRGKGNYIDGFKLPGMLHMETLRSPIARARITSIDTSRAWMTPGVHLVVTGEMAAQHNLAWMPTLSYDTQAVLATDKVRFQGQEICCVVADDPYIAKDACEVIVVEYDPLDRKSTRLNSSHSQISYAVFCLKKKKKYRHSPLLRSSN